LQVLQRGRFSVLSPLEACSELNWSARVLWDVTEEEEE
jgi:hypothetical protein